MPADHDAVALALAACRGADDKKATDLAILDVADLLGLVDLFVLATAANERQLKAVAEEIERVAREELGRRARSREGTPTSGWVLLDFGDVVVHVFDDERRSFYDLERLWADVPRRSPESGALLDALHPVLAVES